jgi:hypothetical protein
MHKKPFLKVVLEGKMSSMCRTASADGSKNSHLDRGRYRGAPTEWEFINSRDLYPGNRLTNVGHNIFGWDATVNKRHGSVCGYEFDPDA